LARLQGYATRVGLTTSEVVRVAAVEYLDAHEQGNGERNGAQCYFISFMYGASEKTLTNDVIEENPLKWQRRVEKSHPGQYVLKDWKEISKEEYKEYKRGRID
jgi:hypothetical protein